MAGPVVLLAVAFGCCGGSFLVGHHRAWRRARKNVEQMVRDGAITWNGEGF